MPKSSSFTRPSGVTSTLLGFRSRCSTRLLCACATAASTSRNSRIRASIEAACASHQRSIGSPSTYSSTKKGCAWPALSLVTPASSNAAMFGCERRANSRDSRAKRSPPSPASTSLWGSFTAALLSKRPSLRRASHTLPIPPAPNSRSRLYAPTMRPASSSSSSGPGTPASR